MTRDIGVDGAINVKTNTRIYVKIVVIVDIVVIVK